MTADTLDQNTAYRFLPARRALLFGAGDRFLGAGFFAATFFGDAFFADAFFADAFFAARLVRRPS